ncbi:MAG: DUF4131 domain-containing protein, partial [Dehalococcoidia bacterium]
MTLLWLAAAFVAGVWIGAEHGEGWAPGSPAIALWAAAASALGLRAILTGGRVLPAVVLLVLLAGLARGAPVGGANAPADLPEALRDGGVTVEAALLAEPRPYGGAIRLPLLVDAVIAESGRTLVEPPLKVDVIATALYGAGEPLRGFRYGDRYRVAGRFEPLAGDVARP